MWPDDLHHALHVLLTGEREGYYSSFGTMDGLVRELTRPAPERLIVAARTTTRSETARSATASRRTRTA